jgi:hypothetical protein
MREILNEPIESSLDEAAEFVDAQAARLMSLRQHLGGHDVAVPVVDRVAEELDAFGDRLATMSGDDVVALARDFARRRGPLAFAAAGAGVGLLAWAGLRRGAPDAESSRPDVGEIESSTGASTR